MCKWVGGSGGGYRERVETGGGCGLLYFHVCVERDAMCVKTFFFKFFRSLHR